jgi:ATP-dependent Lon protease
VAKLHSARALLCIVGAFPLISDEQQTISGRLWLCRMHCIGGLHDASDGPPPTPNVFVFLRKTHTMSDDDFVGIPLDTTKPRCPIPLAGEVQSYPVLPLRDIVVFPHMIVPLFVQRERSIRALDEAMRSEHHYILLVTQKNASDDAPAADALYEVGTLATVLELLELPEDPMNKVVLERLKLPEGPMKTVKVRPEGIIRARIRKYSERTDYYEAEAVVLADEPGEKVEAEAMARSVVSKFESYVKLNLKISPEVFGTVHQIEDYAKLADSVASHLAIKIPDRQQILETTSVPVRLELILNLIESEIAILEVEKHIRWHLNIINTALEEIVPRLYVVQARLNVADESSSDKDYIKNKIDLLIDHLNQIKNGLG